MVRAQLFRASRLALVLIFCHIGHGIASALKLSWRRMPIEVFAAALAFAAVAYPPLLPLLPYALLATLARR